MISIQSAWPWGALLLLGAYHGVNPGMGWLFAVARGLQQRSRRAVFSALLPIAAGHELSIVVVVVAVALSQRYLPPHLVRLVAALVLVSFGLYTLARPRAHVRGSGMRIGTFGLAGWSFLMSSAHGAGLMLAPILLGLPVTGGYQDPRVLGGQAALAASLHVVAMLAVMALVAVVVYERLGLRILRKAWFNLDLVWSGALVAGGAFTLLTG